MKGHKVHGGDRGRASGEAGSMPPALRRRNLWLEGCRALLLLGLLVLLRTVCFDETVCGERLREGAYEYIQNVLRGQERAGTTLPVQIVDISELPSTPATSRQHLSALLRKLSALQEPPRGLAIDVDFSPDENGYITDEDPAFFDECLAQPFPVYLGVHRTVADGPAAWLGVPKYAPLAAAMIAQRKPREQLRLLGVDRLTQLRTLGAALAATPGRPANRQRKWRPWFLSAYAAETLVGDIYVERFLPDYGRIEQFQRECVTYSQLMANPQLAAGKAVLVGDVRGSDGEDTFRLPARDAPVKGVLIHASVAYTLLVATLYDLTRVGRIGLDIVLGLSLFSLLAALTMKRGMSSTEELPLGVSIGARGLLLLFSFVLGVSFVWLTRVVWDDWPLVALGVVLEEPAKHLLTGMLALFRRFGDTPDE